MNTHRDSAEPQDAAPTVTEALRTLADLCGERGLYPLNVEEALRALANRPRVDKITIRHEHDDGADLSHIGRYSDTPGPDDRTVDRFPNGTYDHGREYRYFIAAMSGDETGNPDSVRQDYVRMEAYNRGEWSMLGIYAVAEVSYSIGGKCRRIERFQSGGLWGIESDSGQGYIEEVEQDELADLKSHLERFGVNTDNWADVAAKAARR